MSKKKGLFITLEGGEGSGKSTVIQLLSKRLSAMGYDVIITREPGGVAVSEKIRDLLVHEKMDPLTEAMLFAASRNEITHQLILPALEEGKVVLCDRFVDSSYVYQGMVRGIGLDVVERLNQPMMDLIPPDYTFYLDLDPRVGLERIRKNHREINKFDEENLEFHERVRESYRALSKMDKHRNRIYTIQADQSPEKVASDCLSILINGVTPIAL